MSKTAAGNFENLTPTSKVPNSFNTYGNVLPTDYSDINNWYINDFNNELKKNTVADAIYFYGTAVQDADQENGVALITERMRKEVPNVCGEDAPGVFNECARIFVPYYRQISLQVAAAGTSHEDLINEIKNTEVVIDICASLDYYFKNYNQGRPFILSGYSQGGASLQVALEVYFGKKENRSYLDNMVAAYSFAYGIDKKWFEKLDYLKFAEGEKDYGVVLSWNSEGPGEKGKSFLLSDDPYNTLLINPINWKLDETYASATECLGSYVEGEGVVPGRYNLQIDLKRGSLICDNNEDYIPMLWGGKSLHSYEVSMSFSSIRENVHQRLEALLSSRK